MGAEDIATGSDASVLWEQVGQVGLITLNRATAGNSLNGAVFTELGVLLTEALANDSVRALVLTGTGERFFCTGMDLSAAGDFSGAWPGGQIVRDFMTGDFPTPIVAAVNGAAVGGGFELVLASDLVVAEAHARFGLPEVTRGLIAGGGGTLLATRIPQVFALELALTGALIEAPRALELGLLNEVVEVGAAKARAIEVAQVIAGNAPLAIALTKKLVRARRLGESEELMAVFGSSDAREGGRAFAEKRRPEFRGA